MALIWADRVVETTTTTGTGALTLAGAATGCRAFSAVCTTNDTIHYMVEGIGSNGAPTGEWEVGLGTYSGANTLTRTTVLSSSNSNVAVTFSAGTKRVAAVVPAAHAGRESIVTTDSGTAVTAALVEGGTFKRFTAATAVTYTIPPNSSIAFPVNTVINFEQGGAGTVTLAPGSGVTLNSRGGFLATSGQYAVVQVKKVATDTWTVIGDVA